MKKWKISDFKTREEIQNEIDSLESSKQEHLEKDDLPSMYFEAIDAKLEKLYDKLESIKDMTESRLPSDGSDPEFGVPQEEKYPLYDKKHVISAIKLFGHVNPKYESQLAHAIIKRMKKYNIPFSMVGEDNNLHKYIPLTEQLIKKSKKLLLESDTVITNKIADVLDEIKDIKYGFINKNDGSRILDREWIHNTDDLDDYYDVNWDPTITLKNKLGICLDQSIAIRYVMKNMHPDMPCCIYALRKGRFGHAVPTFIDDEKYYYLENAWDKEMGMHGPFNSKEELENYLSGLYHKHHDKDNDDEVYVYPYENENLTEGWKESEEENEKYVVNGKVFKTPEDADKYREQLEKEKLEQEAQEKVEKKCEKCGCRLNDGGTCPKCDDGDEKYNIKESYLNESDEQKPLSKIKSEYTQYVIQHKNNVIKGFNFIKQYVPEMLADCNIGKLNGLIARHDASKYSTDEFVPYAHFFYGNGRTQEVRDNFKKAWQHHWKNNPHHPEWWNMRDMSNEHIVEMICDWWSFGWKNNNMQELFDYYKSTDKRQYMSENTKKVLAKKMKMLRDKLRQMRLIK